MSEKTDKKDKKQEEVGEFISDPEPIDLKWKEFFILNIVDHYR